jgi:hypothetical protein
MALLDLDPALAKFDPQSSRIGKSQVMVDAPDGLG